MKKMIVELLKDGKPQKIEILPPDYGQVILTFHDGKLKLIEENKKTQLK
ncbi:hypothetical protein [Enterococcus sp. CSURQ0835]|nr:hypothetical protein [Enterococcus sp. CSURQ0835]